MIADTTRTERVTRISSQHSRNMQVRSTYQDGVLDIVIERGVSGIFEKRISNKDLCAATAIHDELVKFTQQYVAKIDEFIESVTKGGQ